VAGDNGNRKSEKEKRGASRETGENGQPRNSINGGINRNREEISKRNRALGWREKQ